MADSHASPYSSEQNAADVTMPITSGGSQSIIAEGRLPEEFAQHSQARSSEKIQVKQNRFASLKFIQGLRFISLFLHGGLVLLHVLLLVIWYLKVEQRATVPVGPRTSIMSAGIITSMQIFITVYGAALVAVTQQLAMRHDLLTRQTITATHDRFNAWNGLGAALQSIWRQISIPASFWGTLTIGIYLGCIAILHIYTPSIFILQPFNSTKEVTVRIKARLPVIPGNGIISRSLYQDSSLLLSVLGRLDQIRTPGLRNSTLYDIPLDYGPSGNVTVDATTFIVKCGAISGVSALGQSTLMSGKNATTSYSTLAPQHYQYLNSLAAVKYTSPNVFQKIGLAVEDPNAPTSGAWSIFLSTLNFTDSNGGIGSMMEMIPPMNIIPFFHNGGSPFCDARTQFPPATIYAMQILGCTLSAVNHTVTVDTQSQMMFDGPSETNASSIWDVWAPPSGSDPHYPFIDFWGSMLGQDGKSNLVKCPCDLTIPADNGTPVSACDQISFTEEYIMGQLGMRPIFTPNTPPMDLPQLTLSQLENALANMTAALFWNLNNLQPALIDPGSWTTSSYNQTTATQVLLISCLNLMVIPLSLGLCVSTILLLLAIHFVRNSKHSTVIDGIGLLQFMWLFQHRPEILHSLSNVDKPSTAKLRKAGMFAKQCLVEEGCVGDL